MWSDWNWAKLFLWVIQAHPRTPSHTCAHSATSLYTCTRRVMWKLSWRSFRLPLLFPFCLMASGTSSLPLSSYPSSQFIRLLNQSRCSLLPSLNFIEESGSRSDLATSKRCPELKGVQQRAELSLKYSINLQLIRNLSLICSFSSKTDANFKFPMFHSVTHHWRITVFWTFSKLEWEDYRDGS